MKSWITEYIRYVEKHPKNFNNRIKRLTHLVCDLLKRNDIFYKSSDPLAFEEICRDYFPHTQGEYAGQPLLLNREQKFIAACVLGIKTFSSRHKCYLRYFKELDLFVSRKWGKDHFIVPLVVFLFAFDKEPAARCQIVAENEKQSKDTFKLIADNLVKPPLCDYFIQHRTDKYIECTLNNGTLEYLSGRDKGKDGPNVSIGVCNEAHEVTNINQYTALKTGMGARRQPMMIVISTAGTTPESLYEFLYERNCIILEKEQFDDEDRIFPIMFGIDDDDNYLNTKCWIKANPAMIESRPTLDYLKQQFNSMKNDSIMLNKFIAKHLNRQIGASSCYYDILSIKKAAAVLKRDDYFDKYAVGGVDLSATTDLCNATAKILHEDGKFIILQAYFIAENCLARKSLKDKKTYELFTSCDSSFEEVERLVIITPGNFVQKEYVTEWFVFLRDILQISFLKIGYDTALSAEWIADMAKNGFNPEIVKYDKETRIEERDDGILTMVRQGGWSLSEAIKVVNELFLGGKIIYDKSNKLLPFCFRNLKVKVDSNNNMSPHKAKSTGQIDGTIGVLNAFVAYQRAKIIYKDTVISHLFKI